MGNCIVQDRTEVEVDEVDGASPQDAQALAAGIFLGASVGFLIGGGQSELLEERYLEAVTRSFCLCLLSCTNV